ncbi:MAG: TAT-variant-translocated molybdopterin oxidoreductase [Acidobacteriia bacterium]|nr:TAT-variant-translocated molybdopterin oxidoreductase [Terriglobia bacterium]
MDSGKTPQYWKSWEEGPGAADLVQISTDEFPEPLDRPAEQFSRRSFLKAAGFTAAVAAAGIGCSRAPVEKAIPYLIQPEEIVPGVSYFYATTCGGCPAACGVLAKNRDGRPIKLEGNPQHPVSRGGLCAVGQASLLELYDSHRCKEPQREGKPATWEEVDRQITAQLALYRNAGSPVRFLSGTISSPTLNAEIRKFLAQFRDARHIVYDGLSSSAILDAHKDTHGERLLPHYRFDHADVIVSFDADFLGTWISPVEFSRDYAAGRRLDAYPPRMSYHAQFESRMSVTGAKADRRIRVSPQELGDVMVRLAGRLAHLAGAAFPLSVGATDQPLDASLDDLAHRLWQARGRSLVLCGSQDIRLQVLVNFINDVLGNYGSSLDLERPSQQKAGNDRELQALLEELRDGKIAALFLHGVNPVYDLPNGDALAEQIRKVPLVVSFAGRLDETSALARFVCPDHHSLESWGDAEPVRGTISLFQPAIHPLSNTRAVLESLAIWGGQPKAAYDILRDYWRENVFPQRKSDTDFQTFWDRAVEAGYAEAPSAAPKPGHFRAATLQAVPKPARAGGEFSVVLYPKVAMLDGRHAENPWLQELPDPISKVTWDNYACVSPAAAQRLGLKDGDVVRLEADSGKGSAAALELPVYVQPGQHDQVIAVALGYGRKATERFASAGPKWLFGGPDVGEDGRIGKNAAPMLILAGGSLQYVHDGVRLTKTGRRHALASTQTHHSLTMPQNVPLVGGEHREIVRETTVSALLAEAGKPSPAPPGKNGLWPADHPYNGHRWAMAIDLTACTGCSGCVVACQAENNIPVVGKDEVLRHREMHWMRIDRYYSGDADVDVVQQPMVCQQCDNAPCETVCPVVATVHSAEGLNQQIYNRCVGTRYCANNCPYKVRRFNWFNYVRNDRLQNLALNPDVTVRSRGVMEKCSFCVQRIEAARIESRRRGKPIADGQIQTACQQSCSSQAIVFGDLNDPNSRIARMARDPRRFGVLEEFNFRPAVNYLAVVRNRDYADRTSKEGQNHG